RTLDKPYEERPFQLRADDLLALYSDGVPEAYNEQEQEWGEAKLQTCLLNFNVRPRLRLQPTPR
ncbi:MAG: SpoIIE family protein phosphatase, partial [Pyrinomonadaceae bacterium]|nr:SpoIIE family protein phosphatase [Pyrinomonadaceae bacterium]